MKMQNYEYIHESQSRKVLLIYGFLYVHKTGLEKTKTCLNDNYVTSCGTDLCGEYTKPRG